MSEQEQKETISSLPKSDVDAFTEKLNQFIESALNLSKKIEEIDERLLETEKAVGWLLRKDKDFMASYQQLMQEEQKEAKHEQQEKPESVDQISIP